MKKSTKTLTSSMAALASLASIVAPTSAVLAEGKTAVEVAVDAVVYAEKTVNFFDWNLAFGKVVALGDKEPQYFELLARLAKIEETVKTADVKAILTAMDKLAAEKNLTNYYDIYVKIAAVSNANNKGYLFNELNDWGKKAVFTPEIVAATDALLKAQTDLTPASLEAAKAAVAKVTGEGNLSWLNEQVALTAKAVEKAQPLPVDTVNAVTNNKVEVALKSAISLVPAVDKFAIKDASGAALEVKEVKLSADGKKVTLTTAAQTAAVLYTVTIEGKEYKVVGQKADTTKPTLTSAVATKNTKVELTFSENVDENALNVANYKIEGLSVVKAQYAVDADGNAVKTTVVLTTAAQTQGSIYKVVVTNVTDLSLNVINADYDELEFGGVPADADKPTLSSAVALTNTTVKVTFNEEMDEASAENVANYKIEGLAILKAELQSNKKDVKLTTAAQTQGSIYKLVVAGVKDESGNVLDTDYDESEFGGVPADAEKPELSSAVALTNTSVKVTFNEDMDKASAENIANYKIEGLAITKAELDEDDNKVVKLTTAAQAQGSIYKLVVAGVKDASGNVLDTDYDESEFGGVPADSDKPTLVSAISLTNTTVKVTFSEVMDSTTALQAYNYYLGSELGYPTKVAKDTVTTDGTVWILTTKAQETKAYTLDVTGVKDLSGNVVNEDYDTADFGGLPAASDTTAPEVSSAVAINKNTIKVTFNEALASSSVSTSDFAIAVQTGTEATQTLPATQLAGTTPSAIQVADDKKSVTLQYANAVMTPGVVYKVTVTGVTDSASNGINTAKNTATFAGTSIANPAPKVASVVALNNQTLKITFSEAVTVDTTTLVGSDVVVSGTTFSGTFADAKLSADKKELTVYYSGSGATDKFVSGSIYEVKLSVAKFTDELNVATLANNTTDAGESAYTVKTKVAGTAANVTAPKVASVVAVNKNTIDVTFNQKVDVDSITTSDIAVTGSAATAALVRAEGEDSNKIRVFFNGAAPFTAGNVYELDINEASVVNFNGTLMVAADSKAKFAAVSSTNADPKLVSVYAKDSTHVVVTFSEAVTNVTADDFAGVTVSSIGNNGDTNAATYELTVSALTPGTIYELSLAAGKDIKDEAGVGSADTAVKVKFSGR